MTRLLPCPSCHRHVRIDAGSCPFCSATLALSAPPLPTPVGRLTRAAVFAGAALAASCGGNGKTAEGPKLENQPTADAGADMAPQPDAEPVVEKVPDYEHHQPMPYGAPPARDRLV